MKRRISQATLAGIICAQWLWAASVCVNAADPAGPNPDLNSSSTDIIHSKKRSLKELIDYVMIKGKDYKLRKVVSKDLGFSGDMPAKYIRGRKETGGFQYGMDIVLSSSTVSGKLVPMAIILIAAHNWNVGQKERFQMKAYRLNLEGRLETVVLSEKIDKPAREWRVPVNEQYRLESKKALDLFLNDSIDIKVE